MISKIIFGGVMSVLVFCLLCLLCISASTSDEDWDDDKGKGE